MNEKTQMEKYSDEIDLYELLIILKRRIRYIVVVFVIGIVIGGLVAFLSPNIYQARATLWVDFLIGQSIIERFNVNDNKFLFNIPLQQTRNPEANNISLSILRSFEFKSKVFNRLKEKYGEREDIKEIFKSEIDKEDGKLYKSEIDKKTGSINLISEQTDRKLAEDILKIVIEEFEKELDKVSQVYSEALSTKREKIDKNKNFVMAVIEKPFSTDYPIKPKRKLIVAVAGISALFSGIFLAFLVEWWSNVRTRRM